jgi:hypothetical protein
MPWGKYKDQLLQDIPPKYLLYVLRSRRPLRPELRREIRDLLGEEAAGVNPAPSTQDWQALLRRWHREMVLRFHPDRGGSHEAMTALNIAFQRLQELLAESF